MHLPLAFLAFNLLPVFLFAKAMPRNPLTENSDRTRSYLCGKKLFLANILISTIDLATNKVAPVTLSEFAGGLDFAYKGPIYTWPLPTLSNTFTPWRSGFLSSYFIVLGGDDKKEFLGVGCKLEDNSYRNCIRGNPEGKISSVSPQIGGFKCGTQIIPTVMAIDFAKRA